MAVKHPAVVFGCANIGKAYESKKAVAELLKALQDRGINHLDTAARYPPTSPGLSEKLLGAAGAGHENFTIDSKILITGDGKGSLAKEAVQKSLTNSLEVLGVDKLNVLYCHAPDVQTPIAEQAAAFNQHYKEGKFAHLGVSNFTIGMLEEWFKVADEHGYVKPTFYQGQYNLVCQGYADKLLPFLKKHNVHFVAFSPLAAGFLTGKFTPNTDPEALKGTRFEIADNNPFGKAARHWYDKPSMHTVNEKLKALSETSSISMEGLALRWIVYHSALTQDDYIILGASKPVQTAKALEQINSGPLDSATVQELNGMWAICASDGQTIVSY